MTNRGNLMIMKLKNKTVLSYRSSAAEINPLPSLSNTRNASRISSSLSVSFILRAIIVRNSGKSMVPLPLINDKQQKQFQVKFYEKKIELILEIHSLDSCGKFIPKRYITVVSFRKDNKLDLRNNKIQFNIK